MRSRLRQRLFQGIALLVVVGAGILTWREVVRPRPDLLVSLAREKLTSIFGERVTDRGVEVNPIEDVTILGLEVGSSLRDQPALFAESVRIEHDIVALASGVYRPLVITIESPVIVTQETVDGVELAFHFELEPSDAEGVLPEIRVRNGRLYFTSMEGSERLRDGYVLVLDGIDLDVKPKGWNQLDVTGRFRTRGLDQDSTWITIGGTADVAADTLTLKARWAPLTLTSALLEHLAPEVAAPLAGQQGQSGALTLDLTRNPGVKEGRLRVNASWVGQVRIDIGSFPEAIVIDAQSREQLRRLFSEGALLLKVDDDTIRVEDLVTSLGTGEMRASGRIEEQGEHIRLYIQVHGVRLEDPAIRDALGDLGAELYDSFDPAGEVDAFVQVRKDRGTDLRWDLDVFLQDASFRYVGIPDEEGPTGFPYRVVQATGSVHVSEGRVWFSDVVGRGRNRITTVRLRGPDEKSWSGGETGRILLTDEGPDVRLTVEARDVPVDEDLEEAIRGSEFADLRGQFGLEGLLDQIEVDIVSVPGRDVKAYAEVHLALEDERFRYARFPLLLERVKGWMTLTRPFTGPTTRGEVFDFAVDGVAEGAFVHLEAQYRAHEDAGLLHVTGRDVSLGGALTEAVLSGETTEGGLAEAWRYLAPRGRADVDMEVPLGDAAPDVLRLDARLRGASIRLDAANSPTPLEITDLRGVLRAEDERVELIGVTGILGGAPVAVEGSIEGGPEGRWDLHVETGILTVDETLLAALERLAGGDPLLPPQIGIEPGTRLGVAVTIRKDVGEDAPIQADVDVRDMDGVLRLPGGVTLPFTGDALTVRGEDVRLRGVEAEALGMHLLVEEATVGPDGLSGRFRLELDAFAPTPELLGILPASLREGLGELFDGRQLSSEALLLDLGEDGSARLVGDLKVLVAPEAGRTDAPRGTLVLDPLDLSAEDAEGARTLRGQVRFRAFSFGDLLPVTDLAGVAQIERLRLGEPLEGRGVLRAESARILDVRVRDLVLPTVWQGGILRLDPIRGRLAEGRLQGRIRVHTEAPEAYEGEVRVDEFRVEALREDLAPTGPPLSGLGTLTFRFQNRSGELRDLTGSGGLKVREGNLGDLPVVATVFAAFAQAFDVPDPPRFERADLVFTVSNEVVRLSRFDLAGPLFEMPGRGTVDFGAFVDLTFTPDLVKSFLLPGVMQFPVVGNVLDAVLREDLLYEIRVRGDIATAEPEVVALPPLGLGEDEPFEGTGAPELPRRRLPGWFR